MSKNSYSKEILNLLEEKATWTKLLPADPRKYLLNSTESFTIYRTLTNLLDLNLDHPEVIRSHNIVLKDPLVQYLLDNLSIWDKDLVKGHNRADYLPNQLWLLLDWGIMPRDDERMKNAFESILSRQDEETGQFLAYSEALDRKTKIKSPMWSSALCDHNLIVSILLLAGYKNDKRLNKGILRMNELLTETAQGWGWKCVPWLHINRRGPGRVNDICPMVVIDALRGYWMLQEKEKPEHLIEAGKSLLNCWVNRSKHKPYMFGHGKNFRLPRAPFFWYNIGTLLDACRHYSELIKTNAYRELIAISLLEFPPDGQFIPKSIYQYFNQYSFGQKKEASPWMTFFLSRIYKQTLEVDPDILTFVKKVDASKLKGSKGGPKTKGN